MDSGVCPPLQYQATYFHCPKNPLREYSWDTELTVVTAASDEHLAHTMAFIIQVLTHHFS